MENDGLTGLPTYRHLSEYVERGSAPFGVFFDIDGLVQITNYYGFRPADEALKRVATTVDDLARASAGSTFRVGGDEFLVVLPTSTTHAATVLFARTVIQEVKDLQIEYRHSNNPSRRHLALNAVVSRVTPALAVHIAEVREWFAEKIWRAKNGDARRIEVVADTGDEMPRWAH